MELVIGNKNYSSWSLRGWLMLKWFDLDFSEIRVVLDTDSFKQQVGQYSPAGRVPVLIDGDLHVWDSLAICEYINETYLEGSAWPADSADRALARAISCEMHSGFFNLRTEMPMNCRARRHLDVSSDCRAEIARIDQIWSEVRSRFAANGDWLFGERSIADVIYAPVASRFHTYQSELSDSSKAYVQTVLADPAMKEWVHAGEQEREVIEGEEKGTPV